jgi:hypothetical protein
MKMQKIDISKIVCDICKKRIKEIVFKMSFIIVYFVEQKYAHYVKQIMIILIK